MDNLDDRAAPRMNPAKVFAPLVKRGQLHFSDADSTTSATNHTIYDAMRRARAASVIRREVGMEVAYGRRRSASATSMGGTPASSDEDFSRKTRGARLRIAAPEVVE